MDEARHLKVTGCQRLRQARFDTSHISQVIEPEAMTLRRVAQRTGFFQAGQIASVKQ
jgi:hypothetical protein